jgi:hypothetical protein
LRNIQTCSWLIKYADALEAKSFTTEEAPEMYRPRPIAPQRVGKAEAEKLIYATTICAWLALPVVMHGALPMAPYREVYSLIAGAIVIATVGSLFANPRVDPVTRMPSNSGAVDEWR